MSVQDDYGISEEEWNQLDPALREKMTVGQGKLSGMRLMSTNLMLEDDDRDIRQRTQAVHDSLLGQDAADCKDEPYHRPPSDDVRITILGDVNGDKAVAWLQNKQESEVDVTVPPPPGSPTQPTPGGSKIARAVMLGAALLAGGGLTYVTLKALDRTPRSVVPKPSVPVDKSIYSIEAVPWKPSQ